MSSFTATAHADRDVHESRGCQLRSGVEIPAHPSLAKEGNQGGCCRDASVRAAFARRRRARQVSGEEKPRRRTRSQGGRRRNTHHPLVPRSSPAGPTNSLQGPRPADRSMSSIDPNQHRHAQGCQHCPGDPFGPWAARGAEQGHQLTSGNCDRRLTVRANLSPHPGRDGRHGQYATRRRRG
jgi:hypothetical protein